MFGLDDLMGGIDDFLTGGAGGQAQKYAQQGRDYLGAADVESGPSAYLGADPATRSAQMDVLGELQNRYRQGGLNAIDRGRVADINQGVNQGAATQRAAVMQDAQRRGLYNSGNALVSAQLAGQGAAELGSRQARDAASLAEQAKIHELGAAGGLAGDVRGQDYQRAAAQDAITRFNAAQRLSRAQGIAGVGVDQAGIAQGDAKRRYGQFKDIAGGIGSAIGPGGGA